jgi:hypothetical protein
VCVLLRLHGEGIWRGADAIWMLVVKDYLPGFVSKRQAWNLNESKEPGSFKNANLSHYKSIYSFRFNCFSLGRLHRGRPGWWRNVEWKVECLAWFVGGRVAEDGIFLFLAVPVCRKTDSTGMQSSSVFFTCTPCGSLSLPFVLSNHLGERQREENYFLFQPNLALIHFIYIVLCSLRKVKL